MISVSKTFAWRRVRLEKAGTFCFFTVQRRSAADRGFQPPVGGARPESRGHGRSDIGEPADLSISRFAEDAALL